MTHTQLESQFYLSAEVDNITVQQKAKLWTIKQAKYLYLKALMELNKHLDEYERLDRAKEYRLDAMADVSDLYLIEQEEREKRAFAQMDRKESGNV